MNIDRILSGIKQRVRDFHQETRIRELYSRAFGAYEVDGSRGVKAELESDLNKLRVSFEEATKGVEKETGLI
jgi:hypothetical protein